MPPRSLDGRFRPLGQRPRRAMAEAPLLVAETPAARSRRSLGVSRGNVRRASLRRVKIMLTAQLLRDELGK